MYPDLSYIFDVFGAEVDGKWSIFKTYGLFLMLAFSAAGYMLYRELIKREQLGFLEASYRETFVRQGFVLKEFFLQGLYGFILLGKLAYLANHQNELAERAGHLLFNPGVHMFWGCVGALIAGGYYYNSTYSISRKTERVNRAIYPSDRVLTIVIIAGICGVLGARILALIEHPEPFLRDPIHGLVSSGGMSVFGGMIFGFFVLMLYLRYHKIPILQMLDSAMPSVFIAYGIGRLGCHFSGDGDWGIESNPEGWYSMLPDFLVAETFPHNVAQRGIELTDCSYDFCKVLPSGVFPTSLYEFFLALFLSYCLWKMSVYWVKRPGTLFALYLMLSGTERLCIEMIRINDRYDFLGFQLSQAQYIAIGYIICGVLLFLYFRRKYSRNLA